jgi:predicted metal-dependent peptidase
MLADTVYPSLPDEDEDEDGGHGGFDKHLPGDGNAATDPAAGDKTKQAITQAANAAKACGKLPGSLARIIGEIIEPKKNWRDILRDMVTQSAGKDEMSWAKPHRRKLCLPPHVPFPGRTGFSMGPMVLAVDTSGSISEAELNSFMGAIKEIMEQVRPSDVWIVWWDTNAVAVQIQEYDDLMSQRPYGGGGTNYTCVPQEIAAQGLEPDCVVCLTDGYVYWPDASSVPWPHITVSTSSEVAPFGRTIRMEN